MPPKWFLMNRLQNRKLVNRRIRVNAAGFEHRRREMLILQRIWEILRLQTQTAVLVVYDPSFADILTVQEIARIQLYPRLCRE